MDQANAGNHYLAPEASIAATQGMVRRPPVYTAIALFCWAIGGSCLLLSSLAIFAIGQSTIRLGWRQVIFSVGGSRVILITALGLLGTIAYIVAGRWLWDRRGNPGLILCGIAVGLTYLAVWLFTWR